MHPFSRDTPQYINVTASLVPKARTAQLWREHDTFVIMHEFSLGIPVDTAPKKEQQAETPKTGIAQIRGALSCISARNSRPFFGSRLSASKNQVRYETGQNNIRITEYACTQCKRLGQGWEYCVRHERTNANDFSEGGGAHEAIGIDVAL